MSEFVVTFGALNGPELYRGPATAPVPWDRLQVPLGRIWIQVLPPPPPRGFAATLDAAGLPDRWHICTVWSSRSATMLSAQTVFR